MIANPVVFGKSGASTPARKMVTVNQDAKKHITITKFWGTLEKSFKEYDGSVQLVTLDAESLLVIHISTDAAGGFPALTGATQVGWSNIGSVSNRWQVVVFAKVDA